MVIYFEETGLENEQKFLARFHDKNVSFYAESELKLIRKCEDFLGCRLMWATRGYDDVLVKHDKTIVFDEPLNGFYRKEAINVDGIRLRAEAAYGYEGTHQFSQWAIVEDDGSCQLIW